MIVYDLTCGIGHRFESWFQNAAAFDAQCEVSAVACPFCGNREIGKAPMAPRVARRLAGGPSTEPGAEERSEDAGKSGGDGVGGVPASSNAAQSPGVLLDMLRRLRRQVEDNCVYVGSAFPEQARRIFYGETAPRGIYGEASPEEADALKEEGIETQRIPWLPRHDS